MAEVHSITNALATIAQLETSKSLNDGVPEDLERSIRFAGTKLTQAAGVLLGLPQDIIATAAVLFTRFWVGPSGGSLRDHSTKDISAACVFLVTSPSPHPRSARSILNVYAYLLNRTAGQQLSQDEELSSASADSLLSEGDVQRLSARLFTHEAVVLRTLGFAQTVALPYTLCINYIQALGVFQADTDAAQRLARRAFAHLNSALLSPQLLYLTHQPTALATAGIYLAAREEAVKLPEEPWWEVFDTDREELGFLVVALLSLEGFAAAEQKSWEGREVPLTVGEVEKEIQRRVAKGGDDGP